MGGERRYVLGATHRAPAPDPHAGLNDDQRAAATARLGPVLCIAGAGAGKTRTLTHRAAHLMGLGLTPESVLLLTFTNKAARVMLDRVAELCQATVDPRRLPGGTFHHVAYGLLREFGSAVGLGQGFTLLDREDARTLMDTCLAELKLSEGKRFPKAEVAVELCSAAVNTQTSLPQVITRRRPQLHPFADDLAKLARRFGQKKKAQRLVDFDDLLLYWKLLLTDHPEVRKTLQRRFQAVLVDEYQDTNRLQGDIVDALAREHRNVTVVGDDAQSIYSFRGADFTNIIEFPARYADAQLFKLTRNYRSVPPILALANQSIRINRRQFPKELTPERTGGVAPLLVPARDVLQQADFVAQRTLELSAEGMSLSDIAILYRAHAHGLEVQLELARRGIPFRVRSGVRFSETAHVKDVVAYLRLVHNPLDELAFVRAVRLVPGVGPSTAQSLWEQVSVSGAAGFFDRLVEPAAQKLCPPRAREGFGKFAAALQSLVALAGKPGEMIQAVMAGGYRDYLTLTYVDAADSRAQDLEQLAAYAGQFDGLTAFLAEIALLNEFTAEETREGAPAEKVVLSSIHQSKGLEFRAVFVVWLVDGRFPMSAATRDPDEEEEERRLFYVACTRAKDELYLVHPLVADPREGERSLLRPSRFLSELPSGAQAPYDRAVLEQEPQA
jgi:DNA helicase-2/ATP-dependent DNA helicase PcrA